MKSLLTAPRQHMTHEIPECPWSRMAMDIFTLNREDYLITVDVYSDFCIIGWHFARHDSRDNYRTLQGTFQSLLSARSCNQRQRRTIYQRTIPKLCRWLGVWTYYDITLSQSIQWRIQTKPEVPENHPGTGPGGSQYHGTEYSRSQEQSCQKPPSHCQFQGKLDHELRRNLIKRN